jgi:hypothetical protein
MHMIIRYPTGRRAEALLLSASENRMRIVLRRLNETREVRLISGHWTDESGDQIEIEAIVPDGLAEAPARRTMTAAN